MTGTGGKPPLGGATVHVFSAGTCAWVASAVAGAGFVPRRATPTSGTAGRDYAEATPVDLTAGDATADFTVVGS